MDREARVERAGKAWMGPRSQTYLFEHRCSVHGMASPNITTDTCATAHLPLENRVGGLPGCWHSRARKSRSQAVGMQRATTAIRTATVSGMLDYGYRYLNAQMGRWISRDPDEEPAGPNLSGFVRNNPIFVTDPDGRCPAPLVVLSAEVIGAWLCTLVGGVYVCQRDITWTETTYTWDDVSLNCEELCKPVTKVEPKSRTERKERKIKRNCEAEAAGVYSSMFARCMNRPGWPRPTIQHCARWADSIAADAWRRCRREMGLPLGPPPSFSPGYPPLP